MVVGIKIEHRVEFLWLIYGFDHSVDHIRECTRWKQCSQEVWKGWFSERKGVKMRGNDGKICLFGIRDHEARSSNLRTSTIKQESTTRCFFVYRSVAVRTPLQALLEWSAPSDK